MFWDIVEIIAIGLGLSSIFTFAGIAYTFIRKRIVEHRYRKKIRRGTGSRSVVLYVTIGQGSIETFVKKYINENDELKKELGIKSFEDLTEANLLRITNETRLNLYDPVAVEKYETDIENQLKDVSDMLKKNGIIRVHLFYCGPYVFSAKIGAELSNRCAVIAYQYSGFYRCVGPVE